MIKTYHSRVRPDPVYRNSAVREGLSTLGYRPASPDVCDVLVIWNRYGHNHTLATAAEARGAKVVVMENGYMGRDAPGGPWYALALGHHNGAGSWAPAPRGTARAQGWALLPYRVGGRVALVLPQRGIGPPGVAMPPGWVDRATARLSAWGIPYRVRHHPGEKRCTPIEEELQDAFCTVTWGSGAAIKGLAYGVPCVYDFGKWIARDAGRDFAMHAFTNLNVNTATRERVFDSIAAAQWTVADIASGKAFATLLHGGDV